MLIIQKINDELKVMLLVVRMVYICVEYRGHSHFIFFPIAPYFISPLIIFNYISNII